MNDFASLLILIAAVGAPAAETTVRPDASASAPAVQLAQLGRQCVTRVGSCTVTPRPVNSHCTCGTLPGTIR